VIQPGTTGNFADSPGGDALSTDDGGGVESGDGLAWAASAGAAAGTGTASVDASVAWGAVPGATRDGEANRVAKKKARAKKRGVRLLINRCVTQAIDVDLDKGVRRRAGNLNHLIEYAASTARRDVSQVHNRKSEPGMRWWRLRGSRPTEDERGVDSASR
jgi:hypothetical protein